MAPLLKNKLTYFEIESESERVLGLSTLPRTASVPIATACSVALHEEE
jgi:hypothetical protein